MDSLTSQTTSCLRSDLRSRATGRFTSRVLSSCIPPHSLAALVSSCVFRSFSCCSGLIDSGTSAARCRQTRRASLCCLCTGSGSRNTSSSDCHSCCWEIVTPHLSKHFSQNFFFFINYYCHGRISVFTLKTLLTCFPVEVTRNCRQSQQPSRLFYQPPCL